MRTSILVLLTAALGLVAPSLSRAQGESAVPFLLITPSPQGNGMGGTSASQPTTDASATAANPGQLGLFSLSNIFNAGTYVPRANWLPQYALADLTYGVTSINAGYNFHEMLSLPFELSLGVGYSRVSLDLGRFAITSPSGPAVIGFFDSKEHCDIFSVGIGLEYYVRLGLGFNFKQIESNLSPVGTEQEKGTGSASASATDFGLLLEVPVIGVVSALSGASFEVAPQANPFLDLSFAYARSNVGDAVTYVDPAQADPLPRTAILGLGVEGGVTAKSGKSDWRLASFRLAHQADDLLVTRNPDGTFSYQSGVGDIGFWDNVVLGKTNTKVTMRRGWQVQLAEIFYLRGGTVAAFGSSYSTSGYSICLGGILKCMNFFTTASAPDGSWINFVAEHFDIQFHSATYDGTNFPASGGRSQLLNLVVKGFSL